MFHWWFPLIFCHRSVLHRHTWWHDRRNSVNEPHWHRRFWQWPNPCKTKEAEQKKIILHRMNKYRTMMIRENKFVYHYQLKLLLDYGISWQMLCSQRPQQRQDKRKSSRKKLFISTTLLPLRSEPSEWNLNTSIGLAWCYMPYSLILSNVTQMIIFLHTSTHPYQRTKQYIFVEYCMQLFINMRLARTRTAVDLGKCEGLYAQHWFNTDDMYTHVNIDSANRLVDCMQNEKERARERSEKKPQFGWMSMQIRNAARC